MKRNFQGTPENLSENELGNEKEYPRNIGEYPKHEKGSQRISRKF